MREPCIFGITGEDYVSDEYQADYITFNLGGIVPSSDLTLPFHIGSGQGFMLIADQASAQFDFLSSMQVTGENDIFLQRG